MLRRDSLQEGDVGSAETPDSTTFLFVVVPVELLFLALFWLVDEAECLLFKLEGFQGSETPSLYSYNTHILPFSPIL